MFTKRTAACLVLITGLFLVVFAATKMHYIDQKVCTRCGICIEECPEGAIEIIEKDGEEIYVINQEKCTQCGVCIQVCPEGAILEKEVKSKKKDTKKQ